MNTQTLPLRGAVALISLLLALVIAVGGGYLLGALVPSVDAQEATEEQDNDADLTEGEEDADDDGDEDGDEDERITGRGKGGGARSTDGSRATGLTTDLMLDSARIESLDFDASDEEYVIYKFADTVNSIEDETGFILIGRHDLQEVRSESARLVRDSDDEVLVGFEDGTVLEDMRLAGVDADTVRDKYDEGNPPVTVTLKGADIDSRDTSVAPRLVGIVRNTTLNRVQYEFDAELDDKTGSAGDFGWRTKSGRSESGAEIVDIDDYYVLVEFDASVKDAKHYHVAAGAVEDKQGHDSMPGSLGEDTTAPELKDVDRVGDRTQYDFTFSEDVSDVDESAFLLYDVAGNRYEGDNWTRVDSDTIRVGFPDTKNSGDRMVWAAVDEDAVKGIGISDVTNTVGAVKLSGGPADKAGRTAGPDLIGTIVDTKSGQVSYQFSTHLDDSDDADPSDFLALTEEGDLVEARYFVEIGERGDDLVIVTFDRYIVEAADAFLVEADAVQDHDGNGNPGGLQR